MKRFLLLFMGCFIFTAFAFANKTVNFDKGSPYPLSENQLSATATQTVTFSDTQAEAAKEGCTTFTRFTCGGRTFEITLTAADCETAERLVVAAYEFFCENECSCENP